MDISFYISSASLISAVLVMLIGLLSYYNDKNSYINKLFLLLTIFSSLWIIAVVMRFSLLADEAMVLWSARATFGLSSLLALSLYYFTYYFPIKNTQYKLPHIFIGGLGIIVSCLSFFSPWVVKNIRITDGNQYDSYGFIYYVFGIYFIGILIAGIFNLVSKRTTLNDLERTQTTYVLIGFSLSAIFAFATNVIIPFFTDITITAVLGPTFLLFFVGFTGYAIVKHHLFNIKVILTELLTFVIWIVLLIKIFLSISFQDVLVNVGIFSLVVFFGIFLIRSVIKEVKQREKIAEMAEDVRRAYEVEKKANQQLEELSTFKDRFLTQTQHDLRTPLTAIMGYTDMIQQGMFGKQTKKMAEVVKKIQLVSKGMKAKADNFLDLAQFQLGKSPVTLKDGIEMFGVLDEVKDELDFKAQSKGIYLTLEKPDRDFMVRADKEKLKAAIFNIVDNAVKYTPKGGVTITLRNHDTVKVIITDTGIGLPPGKENTIFDEQFSRTEQAKKTAQGSGIGLYLSAQIIKAHHGKVWVESAGEGKGSTFHIELPLSGDKTPEVIKNT